MGVRISGGLASSLTVSENVRVAVSAVDLVLAFGRYTVDIPRGMSDPSEYRRSLEAGAKARLARICETVVPIRARAQKSLDGDAEMQRHVRLIRLGGAGDGVASTYVVEIYEDAVGIETPMSPSDLAMLARLRAEVEAGGPRPVSMALMELALHTKIVEDFYARRGEAAYLPPKGTVALRGQYNEVVAVVKKQIEAPKS